jgi:hypothetical protein
MRNDIISLLQAMDMTLARLIASWNVFPNRYKSPDAAYDSNLLVSQAPWPAALADGDSRDVVASTSNRLVFFPKTGSEVTEGLQLLQGIELDTEGEIIINASAATTVFAAIKTNLQKTSTMMKTIETATNELREGKFPGTIFPPRDWIESWYGLQSSMADKKHEHIQFLLSTLEKVPITTVKVSARCNPLASLRTISTDCFLDTVSLLPLPKTLHNLERIMLTPHPVPIAPNDWQIVTKPKGYTYRSKQDKPDYFLLENDLQCLATEPNSHCQICFANSALVKNNDNCLQLIGNGAISTPPCDTKPSTAESLQAIIQETEGTSRRVIIHTSLTQGVLIERCTDLGADTNIPLPKAAIIIIAAGCKAFKIWGSDKLKQMSTAVETFRYPIEPNPKPKLQDVVDNELNQLKTHFQTHGYIYTLSTTSFLLFIIIFIILRFGVTKCCNRCKQRLFPNGPNGTFENYITNAIQQANIEGNEIDMMLHPPSAPAQFPKQNDSLYPMLQRTPAI